jgi:hypothetical protein
MRIWSLNPKLLNNRYLVACWRETLLGKHVLECISKDQNCGYKNHPQLIRFKKCNNPISTLNFYLNELYKESKKRNMNFNFDKVGNFDPITQKIHISKKQLDYEYNLLKFKKGLLNEDAKIETISDLFEIDMNRDIEAWEKVKLLF